MLCVYSTGIIFFIETNTTTSAKCETTKIHNEFHSLIEWNLLNIHLDSLAHWIGTNVYLKYFSFVTQLSIHPVPNFSLSLNPIEDSLMYTLFVSHCVNLMIPDLFCFGLFLLMWPTLGSIWPKTVHIFTQPLNPKKGLDRYQYWHHLLIPVMKPVLDSFF